MATEEQPVQSVALAELLGCETLAQICEWTAGWSANATEADAALVWVNDPELPLFRCSGVAGDGKDFLRKTVSRDTPVVHDLIRDRETRILLRDELDATDWLNRFPSNIVGAVILPLKIADGVIGAVVLAFDSVPERRPVVGRTSAFIRHAAIAIDRAVRAEKRRGGMLRAVERLTSLYDLSKAFGSTIDIDELTAIIAQKAALFAEAEAATLWLLDVAAGELAHAATAANENYDIDVVPEAVGASIAGEIVASCEPVRENEVDDDSALATENEEYPVRNVLAVPLVENERVIGALVVVNKRGRRREFTEENEELLSDLARQAARALHNARQYEAERKVEELDALLTVSREITATLDLDRVLKAVVNGTSALVTYDRCGIAIMQRGTLRLNAISGTMQVDRSDPSVKRLEDLLQWVFLSGSDIGVLQEDDGAIVTDREETEEKFRVYFEESGVRSFYGIVLEDDEGKLGVLGFESSEALVFDEETRDMLQIVVSQATVAVRNAQLYQQVPLAGFLKPLAARTKKIREMKYQRVAQWAAIIAGLLLLTLVIPWRPRVVGPARVLPGNRISLTVPAAGVIDVVAKREGDLVRAGDMIGRLRDDAFVASLADAKAEYSIAEADVARSRVAGNPAAMFQAAERADQLREKIALAEEQLSRLIIRAPKAAVVMTPRLEERVGTYLQNGEEFAALADVGRVRVQIAVPESEIPLVHAGDRVAVKVNTFPGRTFDGVVARLGAEVEGSEKERYVAAECELDNRDHLLNAGMLGKAKITTHATSLAHTLFRGPARWLWTRVWPLLP